MGYDKKSHITAYYPIVTHSNPHAPTVLSRAMIVDTYMKLA